MLHVEDMDGRPCGIGAYGKRGDRECGQSLRRRDVLPMNNDLECVVQRPQQRRLVEEHDVFLLWIPAHYDTMKCHLSSHYGELSQGKARTMIRY